MRADGEQAEPQVSQLLLRGNIVFWRKELAPFLQKNVTSK